MGLAGLKSSWQRQTTHFGHERASDYSVLLVDNRGMGESDKPLARYSTSEMARDLIEVLDHVGWTQPRSFHAAGISLGGMILQELACLVPDRMASLTLLCTAAQFENTKDWNETIADRMSFLWPKGLEENIKDTAKKIFPEEWLLKPDCTEVPSAKTTPGCLPAPGEAADWEYGLFSCNFQRFQAQELMKRSDPEVFGRKGFLMQLIAAGWHKKSEAQLKEMADKIGRERIAILHGTADGMITVPHGKKLIRFIQPGFSEIVEGMGHAPMMERAKWFNEWLSARILNGEQLVNM
jgi:pimeloyl-ACP methyl ester carboxylesterase